MLTAETEFSPGNYRQHYRSVRQRLMNGGRCRPRQPDNVVDLGPWAPMSNVIVIFTRPEEVPTLSMRQIQHEVCRQCEVAHADMVSSRRFKEAAAARQFAMWRCRKETDHSLPAIGHCFGGRDHTTVLHAVRKVDHLFGPEADEADRARFLKLVKLREVPHTQTVSG